MSKPIQDTIQFALSAEETIVNETVKLNATIQGIVPPTIDEKKLKASIFTLIRAFVNTEWQYSNTTRRAHATGQEEITLTATARVPETENYALDRRREEASRTIDFLSITSVTADTSPTAAQIAEAQRNLRLTILKQAKEELEIINKEMGHSRYRIGDVSFRTGETPVASNIRAASAASFQNYGSNLAGDEDSIGNAVKLTTQATIQLRISRT